MKNIQKIVLLLVLSSFCLSSNTFAQAKTEKEIVIIKKSVDADGNETKEKIVLTGEEAEKYIKEQGMIISEKVIGGDQGEKEMTIEFTEETGGHEEMTVTVSESVVKNNKGAKEIIIVNKSVDKNGNETIEKIILEDEEAEKYIKEHGIKITEKSTGTEGEKEMKVEISAEGEDYKEMTIWIDDEGGKHKLTEDHKKIFIDGDGDEIPEEVRNMLQEKGIDIDELIKDGKGEMKIEEKQKYKVIEIDDEGNKKVIEWNGEGEMPKKMNDLMEKHDTEGKTIKKKIMIIDDEDVDIDVNGEKKIIKIRKEKDGELSEEVYELKSGDEMPEEVLSILKENGIDHTNLEEEGSTKIKIEIHDDRHPSISTSELSKVQLGVMVGVDHGIHDHAGVHVVDFIENGAAQSAGVLIDDIIVKVDKATITDLESLLNVLSDKEPGDVVKLKVLRDGKTKKIKVALKASENSSASEILHTTDSVSTSGKYRTEHKVLVIEGGDIVKCDPNDPKVKKERLTEEEIEIVEERIIEETGMEQVDIVSGNNTLDISALDLYPNPTDGSIRVRFHIENQESTKVQIIDIAGRPIYEKSINDFSGIFDEEIQLAGNGMGTMVLVITQGNKAFTEKILLN